MQRLDHAGRDHGARVWHASDAVHIDVRGLDPPKPMLAILQIIDQADANRVIVAHLDREPIFLYPELSDRGWWYEIISHAEDELDGESEVMLRIAR